MNDKKESKFEKISYIIILIVLCICIYIVYQYYQENNFKDFVRSEENLNQSEFKRDSKEKYSDIASYKINSPDYNDAMFYKEIKVEKNKPYKVTCMVKTRDVISKENASGVGAQISIEGTTERSVAIKGTSEWQKIELIFNSKNRESIKLGFRLGGYLGNAKGEAWFSNFTLKEGVTDNNNEWKFACFILKNTDVNIEGNQTKLEVTGNDIDDITDTLKRFETSVEILSQGKMKAKTNIYEISTPLTELSYDDEFGYYVSPENVEKNIEDIIKQNDYDHIFVVVRLGDEKHQNDIQINDWIGLGGMDYFGIGFSNIRLPNSTKSYIYKYNTRINQFPEEVFLHEFLHTLERNAEEYGYERPKLHDLELYGYKEDNLIGQKIWYTDYMNKNIKTESGNIGLPQEVFMLKPAKNINFNSSYEMNEFKEPQNLTEEIKEIINNLKIKINVLFDIGS